MSSGRSGATPDSASGKRKLKLLTIAVLIPVGIVLISFIVFFGLKSFKAKTPAPAQPVVAELASARGMILVQDPGRTEWREVKVGDHLIEGDLVRTDSSGEAGIRYKSGTSVCIPANTVFTVRSAVRDEIEVSQNPSASLPPLLLAGKKGAVGAAKDRPMIELEQIIPFGRSLELIGRVEAGSNLVINNEIVEVTGNGFFKHFTSPFPASATKVQLTLRVTDLAGRICTWTAYPDFGPQDGNR
jgi:hypothetical protein